MSMEVTVVSRMKLTPCAAASHAARRGIASRESTRNSTVLSRTAVNSGAASCGKRRRASRGVAAAASAAISVVTNASNTPTDSGWRAVSHRPVCTIGISAAAATSRHTSRLRRARAHIVPRSCPVTVTKPKLRIEAPLACVSRSITMTRSPLRTPARAVARPMMPAPMTARSNRSADRPPVMTARLWSQSDQYMMPANSSTFRSIMSSDCYA